MDSKITTEGILKNLKERIIKSFLDIIVLGELQKEPLAGYDVISIVSGRYHFSLSAGTVYSLLYRLERGGLIEPCIYEKKRIYKITEKGKFTITTMMNAPYMKSSVETFKKSNSNNAPIEKTILKRA